MSAAARVRWCTRGRARESAHASAVIADKERGLFSWESGPVKGCLAGDRNAPEELSPDARLQVVRSRFKAVYGSPTVETYLE